MAYDNTNRGAIWPNEDKITDAHPDFKGHLNVNGVEYWVSAWKRKQGAKPKSPSLSFQIQEKERQGQSHSAKQAENSGEFFDDDIAF